MVDGLARYPLLDALRGRRSRRFAPGMRLDGGPLSFESRSAPAPLTLDEQAALAFAACGITGPVLAELPYEPGEAPESGGGHIMMNLVGRTAASGDGSQSQTVFVIDDAGTWLLRRPQDVPPAEISELVELAHGGRLTELYERERVRIATQRVDVPHDLRYVLSLNKWSMNAPGTTYFLPVAELTAFYINILLSLFDEEFRFFVVDERNRYRPAGVGRFARSKGGHLRDDLRDGRVVTVATLEMLLVEFAAIEQGGIHQNLGLMTQALGLGGFAHYAAHPWIWERELGFRMENLSATRVAAFGPLTARVARLLGKDVPVPTPVGLERDGGVLIEPFCPPYHATMREAVLAFVERKESTLRGPDARGAWSSPDAVRARIPGYSEAAIEATCAYATYVHERYGRFPAASGPFRTALAYQASRLDLEFYERFYVAGALTDAQRSHSRV